MTSTEDAVNERLFREANEAIQRHRDSDPDALLVFLCECSDLTCSDDIALTSGEYANVRGDELRFAVATGHETDGERVVDEFDRYIVVEKDR